MGWQGTFLVWRDVFPMLAKYSASLCKYLRNILSRKCIQDNPRHKKVHRKSNILHLMLLLSKLETPYVEDDTSLFLIIQPISIADTWHKISIFENLL